MSNEKMEAGAGRGWLLAAMAAPLAHASGAGWLVAGVLAGIALPLTRRIGNGWERMGKPMLFAQLVWMSVMLGILLQSVENYWPAPRAYVVALTLLVLAALPISRERSARIGAVLLWAVALLFVPIGLCALGEIRMDLLMPRWDGWAWAMVPGLLLPGLYGLVQENNEGIKKKTLAVVGIFVTAMGILTQGIVGERISQMEPAPLHVAAQTMRLGGLSRFEVIVSMAMTLSYYAMTSYMMECAKAAGTRLGITGNGLAWCVATVSGASLLWLKDGAQIWAAGCVIAWCILPILYGKRKLKKDENSA